MPPALGLYVPAGHCKQEVDVGVTENVPAGHKKDVADTTAHRSAVLSQRKPAAHSGVAASAVQAGPGATLRGHQEAAAEPHPGGDSTAPAATYVNAACGAQMAAEAPWQVSVPASHWRPASHRVARRAPA